MSLFSAVLRKLRSGADYLGKIVITLGNDQERGGGKPATPVHDEREGGCSPRSRRWHPWIWLGPNPLSDWK